MNRDERDRITMRDFWIKTVAAFAGVIVVSAIVGFAATNAPSYGEPDAHAAAADGGMVVLSGGARELSFPATSVRSVGGEPGGERSYISNGDRSFEIAVPVGELRGVVSEALAQMGPAVLVP